MSLWGLGKTREAVEQYRLILQMKPNWVAAANSLAWILATDKDKEIRNGDEAVKWALVACKGTGRENPEYLDTLAAAYAESGQFGQAIQTVKESIELARSAKDEDLVQELANRLEIYKSKKAFYE
jgi:tetratricopeptide (TPR) repeat protein